MTDTSSTDQTTISDLADKVSALLGRKQTALQEMDAWTVGTADGGPNSDGRYPLTDWGGVVHLIACPASIQAYADSSNSQMTAAIAQFQQTINSINNALTQVENAQGDAQATQQMAYDAQAAQLAAAASALAARFSQSMYFPSDFASGTEYWTEGNGQIAAQTAAVASPLSGTFPAVSGIGVVYQTESNPESCNSFGPLGYMTGVPGTKVVVSARVRAITDNTTSAGSVTTGLGLVPLNADFSLVQYITGTGMPNTTVAGGWQTFSHTYTIPYVGAASYYRPTLFYNVNGNTPDPFHPSNDVQGNQQFQVAWMSVATQTPAQAAAEVPSTGIEDAPSDGKAYVRENQGWVVMPITSSGGDTGGGSSTGGTAAPIDQRFFTSAGSGTYSVPTGTTYLRVRIKGGGGGGSGSGGGGSGGDGGDSKFGTFTAGGGKNGNTRSGGSATGGWKNMPGQPGSSGVGGYTFHPGGAGGGAWGGSAVGSTDGSNGLWGCGGGGAGVDSGTGSGSGGGEGGEVFITVRAPLDLNYVYSVGAGGSGGTAGSGGRAGGSGGTGLVEIEAY